MESLVKQATEMYVVKSITLSQLAETIESLNLDFQQETDEMFRALKYAKDFHKAWQESMISEL
jgi:FtsZ-binding cell division protein ZapB